MLFLLLSACGSSPGAPGACPSFDDLRVTDPDGVATDTDMGRVTRTLASFEQWTGADGVCVDEVRFVPDGTCGAAGDEGCWDGTGNPILVEEDVGVDTARTLLCRALVESPGSGVDPSTEFRSYQWFLWACAKDPSELLVFDAAADSCPDLSVSRAQARFLLDEVYPRYDRSLLAGTVGVTLDRRAPATAYQDAGGWVESGDALYAFGGSALEPDAEVLLRADPATLAVDARLPLPDRVDSARRRLLPTPDGPPVVVYAEETTRAFRPDAAMTEFADVAFPALEEGAPVSGFVSGTTAWLGAWFAEDGDVATISEVDLATGARTVLEAPGLFDLDSLHGDADRLVGVGWMKAEDGGNTAALVDVDPLTRTVTLTPFPYRWRIWDAVGGGDHVLAAWGVDDVASVAVYDPGSGTWSLATDPCGEDRLAGRNEPVSIGGQAAYWEEPGDDEPIPAGPWLTTVSVE